MCYNYRDVYFYKLIIILVGGIYILKKVTIDLYEDELNYLLTGLELFCLNLNNIWSIRKDEDGQDLRYTVVFYLYERLLAISNNPDKFVTINMKKPKKNNRKVLNFFK